MTVDGKKYGVYSLSEDKTIAVKQGNKLNVIRIKHGYRDHVRSIMRKSGVRKAQSYKQDRGKHNLPS